MREASRYNWHDRGTDAEARLLAAHQILTPGVTACRGRST
jgi:hypothetical protein